jgi:multidrug efflux system outer membrane protein
MRISIQPYQYFFIGLVALQSCIISAKDQRSPQAVPPAFQTNNLQGNTVTDTAQLVKWWDVYQDPVLQQLIKTALDSNRNLLIAAARVEQARLAAANAQVALYPTFGYNTQAGTANVGRDAQRTGTALDGNVFRALGAVNWEIDIWGRLKQLSAAAAQELLASEANRKALQVSLIAEVATNYFLLRDLDNRLSIAQSTLDGRKESTRIIAERFSKGYVAELDKLQAEQQEALAAATIPAFKRAIVQTENALGLLLGNFNDTILRGRANTAQVMVPSIPAGLPSVLMLRRPDVQRAEAVFQAQLARVGVAKTSLYPSFSLTGLLGFASPQLGSLIGSNGFVASGLAGLTGPIFQFGQNKRRIAIQEQALKEAGYAYEQTIIAAFRDVNVALTAYRTFDEEYQIRFKQATAARKALVLSKARYDFGYTSYLEVLIQETNLFEAELQASQALQQKLSAVAGLYRSLGGGW